MKIAFLGTKGIPNNYGGFEQFAEYLSVRLAARGHEVTVYNPSFHPYQPDVFNAVNIIKIYSPENLLGSAANFIYDHLCLKHALKQNYDVIYEAGYHSVAISYFLLGIRKYQKPVIITNMDGIEWKRSKWNFVVRGLIKKLERMAVRLSPHLISDNPGIRQYYLDHFNRDSSFVPYGADPVYEIDPEYLEKRGLVPHHYFILIARMEPENNIELILGSYVDSGLTMPFIVIGNYGQAYGQEMFRKYSSQVHFIGAVYNKNELDSLRHFSTAYFHGHSVGGTNPSLLEAMACKSFILAHANAFNKGVLGEDAIYFSDNLELKGLFSRMTLLVEEKSEDFVRRNFEKIINQYGWDRITSQHEELFESLRQKESQSGRT